MLDVWLGDALLLFAIPATMLFAVQRRRPRLLPGEGHRLVDLETLEAEYQKRYPVRLLLFHILPVVLSLYFGLRIILWPQGVRSEGPGLIPLVLAVFSLYVASMIAATVLRIHHERKFVEEHPEFSDSFLPIKPRVLAMVPFLVSVGFLIAGIVAENTDARIALVGVSVVGLFIGGQLRTRQVTHSRYELSWDEPIGDKIAEVVKQFGFTPKKLVLMPSLMANAGAFPDGTVVITSALRTLASPAEVAAVVAHELSHARDSEGKKIQRLRQVAAFPMGVLAGVGGMAAGSGPQFEALLPPFIGFGAVTLMTVSACWLGSRTRPMEFKCDRDVANIGLGRELASCLDIITRFTGHPGRWIGLHRFLMTHPSLEERTARLLDRTQNVGSKSD